MVRSLKHLTRNLDDVEAINRAYSSMKNLPARETAIVGSQLLEALLERNFRHNFNHLTETEKQLIFEGYGPLSSFSSKIKMAYALNAIDKDMKNDLEKIKEIRNVFAHSLSDISFSEKSISEICRSFKIIELISNLDKNPFNGRTLIDVDPRIIFVIACMNISKCLWCLTIFGHDHTYVVSDEIFPSLNKLSK